MHVQDVTHIFLSLLVLETLFIVVVPIAQNLLHLLELVPWTELPRAGELPGLLASEWRGVFVASEVQLERKLAA